MGNSGLVEFFTSSAPRRREEPPRLIQDRSAPRREVRRVVGQEVIELHPEEREETRVRIGPNFKLRMIKSLPTRKVKAEIEECAICLIAIKKGRSAKRMPCLHEFHPICINKWLQKTMRCPICRYELEM